MNAENNINSNNKENNPNIKEPLNPQEKKTKRKKILWKIINYLNLNSNNYSILRICL